MDIKEKCSVCNSDIDKNDFYVSENKQYFCSEKCMEHLLNDMEFMGDIWNIRFCPAYAYCEQLNNLRGRCIFKNNITEEKSPIDEIIPGKTSPNWCPAAETSQIISNVKLFNFVKKSEESSERLNKESLNQNKITNKLTWVMTGVSIVNLILICLQIYLQIMKI